MVQHDIQQQLWNLVHDLEAEGFGIFASETGGLCLIAMSDLPTPDFDARMKFNVAVHNDPALKAAVGPFLREHRPAPIDSRLG